ncbi:ATP-dependent RNA helicase vasa-like isoform X2 [Varroa destructor]|uniref:RNA helicase n=1 Tax=Varroa destructor TaxID=109461 RepID=A0A7M7M9Y8_VARDE|nr:ATP-dependent RNA helicase vasa-like isoform X2 [Varroa destructor]
MASRGRLPKRVAEADRTPSETPKSLSSGSVQSDFEKMSLDSMQSGTRPKGSTVDTGDDCNEERSQNADNTSYAPDHDGGCDYVNPRGAMYQSSSRNSYDRYYDTDKMEKPTSREDRGRPTKELTKSYGGGGYNRNAENRQYPSVQRCENCEGKGHDASQCPSAPMQQHMNFPAPSNRFYDSSRNYHGESRSRDDSSWGRYGSSSGQFQNDRYENRNVYQRDNDGRYHGNDDYRQAKHDHGEENALNVHRSNQEGRFSSQFQERMGTNDENAQAKPYRKKIEVNEASAISRNRTGTNFSRYENIQVKVLDRNGKPDPSFEKLKLRSFEDAKLDRELLSVLQAMDFKTPTPVQKYAIPIILANKDIMACAQTGSGKTAAFVLPLMQIILQENPEIREGPQSPLALILAPTRELVCQITVDAKRYGIRTKIQVKECYGGTHIGTQISNIREGCHILVGTTGRVKDFLNRRVISLERLRFLVFDEADRMLDMGFLNDINTIGNYFKLNNMKPQTLMFSATFKPDVQNMAKQFLADDYIKLEVGLVGGANEDVIQVIEAISGVGQKKDRVLEIIRADLAENPLAKILVFIETKRSADFLAAYLSEMNLKTTSIHGNRYQGQREQALMDFQSGDCAILVATSVAARGLDISGVTHVVNFDMPKEADEYVHRVGRTGRLGNQGRATAFFDSSRDFAIQERLKEILMDCGAEVPDFLRY